MNNYLIQGKFNEHTQQSPGKLAIQFEENQYTYADLQRLSRTTAYHFWAIGVRPGDRVAILADRGPELVWNILAVLHLGALFVVLDSSYPVIRLETLVDICAPSLIVRAGRSSLSATLDRLGSVSGVPVFHCDRPHIEKLTTVPDLDAIVAEIRPDLPAYYIFTSGSTGRPKGIACNHRPLTHFIDWHRTTFELKSTDRFTMISGLSHDPILRDIFTPLSIGATLVIPRQNTITEPGALQSWFAQHRITVTHLTPAMGRILSAAKGRAPALPDLRHLFWGGDKLTPGLISEVSRIAPTSMHTNFYGCSETPQVAAFYGYDENVSTASVPIGRGIDGFTLEIHDGTRQPVPVGEIGEIAVKSEFLSLGYVDRGQIIPPDKSSASPPQIYNTGDRGYSLADGSIVLLGRSDDQIKIRGFRVDLAEVTNAMLQHAKVLDAIALPIDSGPNVKVGAFIAVDPADAVIDKDVSAFLADRLPAYMLPQQMIILDHELPLLPNGKVDRRALQTRAEAKDLAPLELAGSIASAGVQTGPERNLILGWAPIFSGKHISPKSSFMSLGGDSLSYVEAYLVIEDVLGVVPSDWPELTIAELSARCKVKSRFIGSIDSFMVVRAVSIVLIVSYHFSLTSLGDGFTGALFVISGYLFGRITLREVFTRQRLSGILVSTKNIALPVIFFSIGFLLLDLVAGKLPFVSEILLSSDLTGYDKLADQNVPFFRHYVLFWYVDCLIKILLIVYVCLKLIPKKYVTLEHINKFCITVLGIACLMKFVVPYFMQSEFYREGAAELSVIQLSPIGNLATFMLGATLANVFDRDRYLLAAGWAIYAIADAKLYGLTHGVSIAGAGALLLLLGPIPVPKSIATVIFTVSGASLFIYLTHLLFGYGLQALLGGSSPLLQVLVAISGGIAVQSVWNWSSRRMRILFQHPIGLVQGWFARTDGSSKLR